MADKEVLKQLKRTSDYEVKLDAFEGPLDLLLHLIKESKLDIKDIFVSQITEQYLSYMEDLDKIDLEKASEFVDVAAQLLEIKSKSLLPRVEEMMPDGTDEEKQFIQKIQEYKLLKEASEKLKPLETVDRYYKNPDESVGDVRFVLRDMTLDGLLDAFSRILARADVRPAKTPRSIALDRFTVADKILQIREIIDHRKQTSFFELFDTDYSKSEIINTFLALLELLKLQFVRVEQQSVFADITLFLNEAG